MIDHPAATSIICVLVAGLMTGCSLGTLNGVIASDTSDQTAAAHGGPTDGAAVNMAGRWVLATPGAGNCGMNFVAPPGANKGAVAPEGGCPGKFFTSRQWALEHDTIVIRNHTGEMLAQLNVSNPVRLDGHSASGEQVSLTR